jgi:wobble nucleotide-excising tRNase
MTLIRCISRLRNCGVFRIFDWPGGLPEFGRFNLIYGWNATGKTTLSRVLRHLEKQTIPEGEARLKLSNGEFEGKQFPDLNLPIRVFNRDFVNESVFRRNGGELPPIFVFGAESVERQKELERLKGKRNEAQSKLDAAHAEKDKAVKSLDNFCIDRARFIKDTLRSSGQNAYNNYDKSDFKRDAENMAQLGDGSAHLLSDEEREKLLTQHRATPKAKVQEVKSTLPNLPEMAEKVSQLVNTTVVSATIETLKNDSKLSEWTREGLELHRHRKAERCLFCEQPLPKERLAALEAHFSGQYEQLMQRLDGLIKELQALSKKAAELQLPHQAEFYDDLQTEYQAAEEGLRQALEKVKGFLDAAVKALMEKKGQLFERVECELRAPSVDGKAVEKLNAVIRKHNQVCDEFQTRVTKARERLAEHMIAEVLGEFVSRTGAVRGAEKNLKEAKEEVERLDKKISALEREIVEHRRPAEELNEDLRKYLGHDELRLEVRDTGYIITRGGVPAQSLSEGEMTAIALLYFLKSLQDKQFDLRNGVVVLDDPVSSLDANALYLAFGFICERTKDVEQLIILTHNFTFFRQVRNWFHHLPNQKKKDISRRPARFYMLNCVRDGDQRCATICQLDPLLEEYESEYHYLFACIYRAASSDATGTLEQKYLLPNMARRLLESFLGFRRPGISGNLREKMESIDFDGVRKSRILRFVHTYSHSNTIGEPEHDPSLLTEAKSVLKDLLELIESEDKAHYDAMVKLVKLQTGEEGEE